MNIKDYEDALLAANGDATGSTDVNDFRTQHVAAVTAAFLAKVDTSTVTALGGTIGGTANDTMTVTTDIALSTSNTYTDAAVNTAVNALALEVRNNMADLQAKVNALITAIG